MKVKSALQWSAAGVQYVGAILLILFVFFPSRILTIIIAVTGFTLTAIAFVAYGIHAIYCKWKARRNSKYLEEKIE